MSEVERMADQLRRAVEGDAWHGPSLRELLEGVDAARAAARPVAGAHSIWEIVHHLAAWGGVVRKRLSSDWVDAPPEGDWPAVADTSAAAWEVAREWLVRAYGELGDAIGALDGDALDEPLGEGRSSAYVTVHGAIEHALYHGGQIGLLKKGA